MTARAGRSAALGGAVLISGYLGWDSPLWDARLQLGLHLAAALAIGALVWLAWRGRELPRTRIDAWILALLTAYAVATLSAWNIGLSAPALAGILATTLMLPVALVAIRNRPNVTALIAVVPMIGLAAGTLGELVWRRVEWLLAGGSGWPPVRLPNEVTPFGSVAVPPFVILAALPVALLVTQPRLRKGLVAGLLAVGVPLTLLSGSRSAWIAITVACLLMAASSFRDLRGLRRVSRGRIVVGALVAAVGAVAIAFVVPRLTQTSSLLYREGLWRDTLSVWRGDPLLGIGPGAMPYARQAIGPFLQPHSHDVPLGILGDAGLLGLAAALLLFARFVWVARPRRGHPLAGRAAFSVLVGVAVGFLTEDLTFLPNFNLLLLLVVAIALRDAGAVTWRPIRLRRAEWPLAAMAGVATAGLLAVALLCDASGIWYRDGTDAAAVSDWTAAQRAYATAVTLDPQHPAAPKSLAVVADRRGATLLARSNAERAVALNPGDWASWTNLSLLCLAANDAACASAAAGQSIRASGRAGLALVNAALVYQALGLEAEADLAYGAALLVDWQTALSVPWPRTIPLADQQATAVGPVTSQLALLVARHQRGEDLRPESYGLASIRALAFAMRGDRAPAQSALGAAVAEAATDPFTWDVAALLLRHWGEDDAAALRMGRVTRGSSLSTLPLAPPPLTYDIAAFRAYPGDALVSAAKRLLVERPWPWVLEPLLAP